MKKFLCGYIRAPSTHEGFKIAWEQLSACYEKKRVLVNAQLKILFSLSAITKETASAIKTLQRDINSCLHIFKMHNISVINWDPILIFHCCQCLPEATLILWEQSLTNKTTIPSWQELDNFLSFRILTLESIQETRSCTLQTNSRYAPSSNVRSAKILVTKADNSNVNTTTSKSQISTKTCTICQDEHHTIYKCTKFCSLNNQERWNRINRFKLCSNCLGSAHLNKDCTSKFVCSTCGARHHSWLHKTSEVQTNFTHHNVTTSVNALPVTTSQNSSQSQAPRAFHQHSLRNCSETVTQKTVLLGTANVLLHHRGLTYSVRALLDSGSEVSCISKTLRKHLNLPSKPANISLLGVNSQVTATASQVCDFSIGPLHDKTVKYECSAFVLPRISGNLPTVSIEWLGTHSLPALQLADKDFFRSSPVDLLIGADLYPSILFNGIDRNVLGSLLAQETAYGWILTGQLAYTVNSTHTAAVHFTTSNLDDQLRKLWELEEIPKKKYLSPDKYCEELFRSTTIRNSEGRYVVKLPFKRKFQAGEVLGNSRKTVLSIFRRNETSLLKKPDFKVVYEYANRISRSGAYG